MSEARSVVDAVRARVEPTLPLYRTALWVTAIEVAPAAIVKSVPTTPVPPKIAPVCAAEGTAV